MKNKIIGGVLGGTVGFIIGAIIVDHLYPEFYEPGANLSIDGRPEYRNPALRIEETLKENDQERLVNLRGQPKQKTQIVDYTRYGGLRKTKIYQ